MKPTQPKPGIRERKTKCDHYWFYEHALWQGRTGREEVAVMRYCLSCQTSQTATASNWHPIPASQVNMRETAEKRIQEAKA